MIQDSSIEEIPAVRHLANQIVDFRGQTLQYSLVDLDSDVRHHFKFKEVLGFRYQHGFNSERIGYSFFVEPSEWLASMHEEPFRTHQLNGARHYLFDSMDGQFEIIAMQEPEYHSTGED